MCVCVGVGVSPLSPLRKVMCRRSPLSPSRSVHPTRPESRKSEEREKNMEYCATIYSHIFRGFQIDTFCLLAVVSWMLSM